MSDHTLSLRLDPANLVWLKAQAIAGHHSLSATLNEILTGLRTAGHPPDQETDLSEEAIAIISDDDPNLETADAAIRELFTASYDRSAEIYSRESA